MHSKTVLNFLFTACFVLSASVSRAEPRNLAFAYETTTQQHGTFALENQLTFENDKKAKNSFNHFVFRHRLKYGLTENWQLSLFLSDWSYTASRYMRREYNWISSGVESVLRLSDSRYDAIGSALGLALRGGDELVELEGRVILQKDIGQFITAYNAVLRSQWLDDQDDRGVLKQTLGASYHFTDHASWGLELLHQLTFEDWSNSGDSLLYLGPKVALRIAPVWLILTPTFQLTNVHTEAQQLIRLLVGMEF